VGVVGPWCEGGPSRFDRRLAFADGMDMHGVLTGLQVLDHEPDQEPAGRLHEIGAADECPMLVLELRVADHRRLLSIRRQREAAEEQTCANELHLTKMSHMLTSLGVRLGYAGAAGVPGACGSWGEPLRGRRGSLLRAILCRSSGA